MNEGIIEMVEVEMLILSYKPGIQQVVVAFAGGVQPQEEFNAESPSQVGDQKSYLYKYRNY